MSLRIVSLLVTVKLRPCLFCTEPHSVSGLLSCSLDCIAAQVLCSGGLPSGHVTYILEFVTSYFVQRRLSG